jgi:hypothetical protein
LIPSRATPNICFAVARTSLTVDIRVDASRVLSCA